MNKLERLFLIRRAIMDSGMDEQDLVALLELSVSELVELLPKRLLEYEHKFVLNMEDGDELSDAEIAEYAAEDD